MEFRSCWYELWILSNKVIAIIEAHPPNILASNCDPFYRNETLLCKIQMEIWLKITLGWFLSILRFLQNHNCSCVISLLWKFWIKIWSLSDVILMIICPMINCKLWKLISPFHTFQYPNGQMGITSHRIIHFQNVNHHHYSQWENVYFISITQIWPCAQKSLILTEWVTNVENWLALYSTIIPSTSNAWMFH